MVRKSVLMLLLITACLHAVTGWAASAQLKAIKVHRQDGQTQVHFRFDQVPRYSHFSLEDPDRVVFDFQSTRVKTKSEPSGGAVKKVRLAPREGELRAVLDLADGASLGNVRTEGQELVATIHPDSSSEPETKGADEADKKANKSQQSSSKQQHADEPRALYRAAAENGPLIVVIDPGHGGPDAGTHGRDNLREKDVTLAVGRDLYNKLKATRNIHPILTRSRDQYVSLENRVNQAQKRQAALFISIHVNSFHKDPSVNGATCYVLSQNGASDAKADQLARFENSSDRRVAGVEFSPRDKTLNTVLTDLYQNTSIENAEKLADEIITEFGRIGPLYSRTAPRANFAVLRNPMTPSVLCETAFLSNPEQARQLQTAYFRRQLAEAMFQGIMNYFRKNPPERIQKASGRAM